MTSTQGGEVPKLISRDKYLKWQADFCGYAKRKLFYKIMIGVEQAPVATPLIPDEIQGSPAIIYKISQDNKREARDYADRKSMGFGAIEQAVNDVTAVATRLHNEFGHVLDPDLHDAWLMVRDIMEDSNAGTQTSLSYKLLMMQQNDASFEEYASRFEEVYRLMVSKPDDIQKKIRLSSGIKAEKLKDHADSIMGTLPDMSYDDFVARLLAHDAKMQAEEAKKAMLTTVATAQTEHIFNEKLNYANSTGFRKPNKKPGFHFCWKI